MTFQISYNKLALYKRVVKFYIDTYIDFTKYCKNIEKSLS